MGCWWSSSLATAEAKMPMGLSEGGKLEWPGDPVTLSSKVKDPFSVTPILWENGLANFCKQVKTNHILRGSWTRGWFTKSKVGLRWIITSSSFWRVTAFSERTPNYSGWARITRLHLYCPGTLHNAEHFLPMSTLKYINNLYSLISMHNLKPS